MPLGYVRLGDEDTEAEEAAELAGVLKYVEALSNAENPVRRYELLLAVAHAVNEKPHLAQCVRTRVAEILNLPLPERGTRLVVHAWMGHQVFI